MNITAKRGAFAPEPVDHEIGSRWVGRAACFQSVLRKDSLMRESRLCCFEPPEVVVSGTRLDFAANDGSFDLVVQQSN